MDGLAPAIAIKQKNQTRNPRSTVATATEIYDYLRLLYARCGTVTCLHCGGIVRHDTVDEIVAPLLALPEGTRVYALFPIVRAEIKLEPLQRPPPSSKTSRTAQARKKAGKEGRRKEAVNLRRRLLSPSPERTPGRAPPPRLQPPLPAHTPRLDRLIVEFSTPESLLELDFSQPIFVLADRLALSPRIRARLVDAIETGYREVRRNPVS